VLALQQALLPGPVLRQVLGWPTMMHHRHHLNRRQKQPALKRKLLQESTVVA
jgi:hypothetical protein